MQYCICDLHGKLNAANGTAHAKNQSQDRVGPSKSGCVEKASAPPMSEHYILISHAVAILWGLHTTERRIEKQ